VSLFQLEQANHSYANKQVLSDINLTIEAGESIAIVGPSGVGKTTLLNLLLLQQKHQIAYCAQGEHLIENLNVFNNIYMAQLENFSLWQNLKNLIIPNKDALAEITKIANSLFIQDKLMLSVKSLSGGQKQRVAIARAIYRQSSIFFGDEFSSNLDDELAQQVVENILTRHQTCVVAIHDRQLALKNFDRVIGLKQGKLHIDKKSNQLTLADLEFLYL